MPLQSIAGRRSRTGFTLTEMLVSVAVLVIIMTFIAQMMDQVSVSTTLSSKHIDTDNQARLTFDRMAIDFGGMLQRPDLDFIFAKQGVNNGSADLNDKMFFYSEAPAYFDTTNNALFPSAGAEANPKSDVALIGYIINTGVNNNNSNVTPPAYCLQRLSKGLTWDQNYPGSSGIGGINYLVFNPTAQNNSMQPLEQSTMSGNTVTGQSIGKPPDYVGMDSSYDVLANQVFRMEYCFQVKDLSNGASGATAYSQYPVAEFNATGATSSNQTFIKQADPLLTDDIAGTVGDRWYNENDHRAFILSAHSAPGVTPQANTWSPLGMSDVTAIVVTIAVMDTNSRKTLSAAQLGQAAAQLPDFNKGQDPANATSNVELPSTTWAAALNQLPAGSFASIAGIPQFAASQIRVYQHFFYLNNNH